MVFGLRIKNIFIILLGSAIMAFGLVHFNMPNNLGEGGLTGITLLLYFAFNWDPAITNILLNIPLFFYWLEILRTKHILLYDYRDIRCFHVFKSFSDQSVFHRSTI